MSTDFEARHESLAYLREGEDLSIARPVWSRAAPSREEIDGYLDNLKPHHFAALAGVIDELVDGVERVDLATAHFPEAEDMDNPFSRLKSDSIGVFRLARERVATTEAYHIAAEYPRVISWLSPFRHNNLDTQLLAGWDTASSFMVTTLSQFPEIVSALSPEASYSKEELYAIAERSFGLSWQMAMLCVNQMMAVRTVLDDGLINKSWSPDETKIDTSHLTATLKEGRVSSVKFADLGEIKVPEGFVILEHLSPVDKPTLVKDIECSHASTIGCPITLLPGRLNRVWNWFVRAVEQRDLWDQAEQ